MEKEELKKILEEHLINLSKISKQCDIDSNPVLVYVLTESIKTISLTLFFLNKI